MENISYVRQDYEDYGSLKMLFEGTAKQLEPEFPGDVRFLFSEQGKLVVFDWVASVMFCDELLWSKDSYPYFKDCNGKSGLFEVLGSSYLKRIQTMGAKQPAVFLDHHHYVYFDREFNWHITAKGLEISDPT